MPDFTRPPIFSPENNFVKTKFGARASITANELNELQDIQNYKRNLAVKCILENGFLNNYPMILSDGVLTVPADIIVVDGDVFEILEDMQINVTVGDIIYLKIQEKEVAYFTELKKSGNLSGGSTIPNKIFDPYLNKETSRRIQKQVELVKENTPEEGVVYLEVATIGEDDIIDNRILATSQAVQAELDAHKAEHLRIEIGVAPPENINSKTFWLENLGESIDFVLGGGLLIGNASIDGSDDVWFDENV